MSAEAAQSATGSLGSRKESRESMLSKPAKTNRTASQLTCLGTTIGQASEVEVVLAMADRQLLVVNVWFAGPGV